MPGPVLSQQNHAFIASRKWELAVLPFGATEPHNYHMPYGTDVYQVEEIARRSAQAAYDRGAAVTVLPAIPFGVNTNHLKIKGGLAISLTPTTLLRMLEDIVDSLQRQGVRKLLLLNGHGGNELKPLMRELHHRTEVFICLCDWFRLAADQLPALFKNPGEHADEMETSLGLAFFPQFMEMSKAGPGTIKPPRLECARRGWISFTRPWHLATDDTGMGNPFQATADKGKHLMEILVERLGQTMHELATAPLDENFPY